MAKKKSNLLRIPTTHVGAALGLSTWGTPLGTYLSCRGLGEFAPNPESFPHPLNMGVMLQASDILKADLRPLMPKAVPSHKFIEAAPDFIAERGRLVVLCRMVCDLARWKYEPQDNKEGWTDPTCVTLPVDVVAECMVLRHLMKAKRVIVMVFVLGKMIPVEFDAEATDRSEAEAKLRDDLRRFWFVNVANERPPSASAVVDLQHFKMLHPKADDKKALKWAEMTPLDRDAVLLWATAKRKAEAFVKSTEQARVRVEEIIGDAGSIEGFPADVELERVDFKNREPSSHGMWKPLALELLSKMTPRKQAALEKKHMPVDGARVLRPFFKKVAVTCCSKFGPPSFSSVTKSWMHYGTAAGMVVCSEKSGAPIALKAEGIPYDPHADVVPESLRDTLREQERASKQTVEELKNGGPT